MKYICSWSGGKDSTASIILAHENHEPLDIILFSEVMFDKERGISGENPKHISFIQNVAKPVFESWGYMVEILRADTDYLDIFHHIIENPRKYESHRGEKYGFPASGLCSIKRDCKEKPIKEYLKQLPGSYKQYVGICIDEPKRLDSLHKSGNKVSLLEKYKYTEQMAMEKCRQYGLLSPAYQFSNRGGCWFCPNAKPAEHLEIRRTDRETWERFLALEKEKNLAHDKWNVYGESLQMREEKLVWMDRQMTIFDL